MKRGVTILAILLSACCAQAVTVSLDIVLAGFELNFLTEMNQVNPDGLSTVFADANPAFAAAGHRKRI